MPRRHPGKRKTNANSDDEHGERAHMTHRTFLDVVEHLFHGITITALGSYRRQLLFFTVSPPQRQNMG